MKRTEEHEALVDDFAHGIAERSKISVVLVGRKAVVFKVAGHRALMGARGCGMVDYVPTQHLLARKGRWWLSNDTVIKKWEGRVARAALQKAFEEAEL